METMLVPCFYLHIQGWREKPENALFKKNNKWQPYKLLQSGLTKLADRKKNLKKKKNKIMKLSSVYSTYINKNKTHTLLTKTPT